MPEDVMTLCYCQKCGKEVPLRYEATSDPVTGEHISVSRVKSDCSHCGFSNDIKNLDEFLNIKREVKP